MGDGPSRIIRVGVAGLGRSGYFQHALPIREMADRYELVGVYDAMNDRCGETASELGCKGYGSFEEMIADESVELVVLACPTHLHHDLAIAALNAGKHVLCEKPMTITPEQADDMIRAARDNQRVLTVFHNLRYVQGFRKLQEIIATGVLGRILLIRMNRHGFGRRWDWQTLREYGGGLMMNTGSHVLDQALQLYGPDEPEIFCRIDKVLTSGDAEDHAKIILSPPKQPLSDRPSPPMIDIEVTNVAACKQPDFIVMGSCGGLIGTHGSLEWRYVPTETLAPRDLQTDPTPDRSYNNDSLPWQEDHWQVGEDFTPSEYCFYHDLYDTLVHDKPLFVTPESVRRVVATVQRCYQAAGMPI